MKVTVDTALCEANGKCVSVAAQVFDLDDNDELHIRVNEISDGLQEVVAKAVRLCPRQALSLA